MARQRQWTRSSFWLEKYNAVRRMFANYVTPHTGLEPTAVQRLTLQTRKRKVYKLRSAIKKLAKYMVWHTGATPAVNPNPVQNLKLQARRQKKLTRATRKKQARPYTIFHTGQFTVSPVNIPYKPRRRKKLVVSRQQRLVKYRVVFHTGATPPPPPSGNWLGVTVQANTKRGGY